MSIGFFLSSDTIKGTKEIRKPTFYIWLIPKTTQDPDPFSPGNHQNHTTQTHRNQTGAILLFIPILSVGLLLYALLNSSSADIVAAQGMPRQEIALLSPALHSDPNPSRGGSDISIQDSMRLVAANRSGDQIFIPKTDQISVYTVREGDSLSHIADTFEVSMNTIRWANDLGSGSTISPGDQLVILPVSGIKHTVRKGDTFSSLAKKYQSDTVEIALFNGLSEESLTIGSEVIIPNGELHNEVKAPARRSSKSSPSVTTNGYFAHPAPGTTRTQGIHGRNAIDVRASIGTPAYAAASGTVIISKARKVGMGDMVHIS